MEETKDVMTKRQVALETINAASYDRNMYFFIAVVAIVAIIAVVKKNFVYSSSTGICILAFALYLGLKKDKYILYLDEKYGQGEWRTWSITKYLNRKQKA